MFTQRSRYVITVTWKTRHFRHFTSEQILNKVSNSEVVEKVISMAECLLRACAKTYKNWWTYVKAIVSQTWDIFETPCI